MKATPYGVVFGLVIAASLGWPYVVGYALIVGPALGWWWVRQTKPRKRGANRMEGQETSDASWPH